MPTTKQFSPEELKAQLKTLNPEELKNFIKDITTPVYDGDKITKVQAAGEVYKTIVQLLYMEYAVCILPFVCVLSAIANKWTGALFCAVSLGIASFFIKKTLVYKKYLEETYKLK